MKDLKNFINESKIDKINIADSFPDHVLIQSGYDESQNVFGILLCEPNNFNYIKQKENEIIDRAKKLGFKVNQKFTDYSESAGINADINNKYTLFAPAGLNETYWANTQAEDDGVEIVLNIK